MPIELVKSLLKQKEGIRLEFKEASWKAPDNLEETVCAFLNREGGSILLGVDKTGSITGVLNDSAEKIAQEISTFSNDSQRLNPPFLLFPSIIEIEGKKIIHLHVPASSQVHRVKGKVFDRSTDGDFNVTDLMQIADITNRKRTHFTEGEIFPALTQNDFKQELLPKIRNLIRSNKPNHPWLILNDTEFFRTAGLLKRDFKTGEEGFTLAAALLLGKDEVIQNILPHYKIDALVRINDLTRYDDRLIIHTNLTDAYDHLMDFTAKHLPDKFFMDGDQRVSLRDKIFREVIANLIVHREYTNAHQASFIIYNDHVEVLNANNPNGSGPISVMNFSPFPKNPTISKFFVQLGRVEELGSGVINVNKYLAEYAPGTRAEFIEGNLFKTVIPFVPIKLSEADLVGEKVIVVDDVVEIALNNFIVSGGGGINGGNGGISEGINEGINEGISEGINEGIKRRLLKILQIIHSQDGLKANELANRLGISVQTIERDLRLLKKLKVLEYIGSKKTGKYFLTKEFENAIKNKI